MTINDPWTSSPFSPYYENRCKKTAWYSLAMFVFCTLVAQMVLTLRLEISLGVQQLWFTGVFL